jgi:ribosomal protein L11 methylase PrmA
MLAGILDDEADQIRDALSARGLSLVEEASEAPWWACVARVQPAEGVSA